MRALCFFLIFVAPVAAMADGSKDGRFQVVAIHRDQFLIDTQSGRLWKRVCVEVIAGDCKGPIWDKEFVQDLNLNSKEYAAYVRQYGRQEEKKKPEDMSDEELIEAAKGSR